MNLMYGAPPPLPQQGLSDRVPASTLAPQRSIMGTGWECPRCRSINAPYITKCDCKPETP